jgi:hypothetical protein
MYAGWVLEEIRDLSEPVTAGLIWSKILILHETTIE